jgi:hypothetical protein
VFYLGYLRKIGITNTIGFSPEECTAKPSGEREITGGNILIIGYSFERKFGRGAFRVLPVVCLSATMGCFGGGGGADEGVTKEQKDRSKLIEKQLEKDRQSYKQTHRLLLLGTYAFSQKLLCYKYSSVECSSLDCR